MSKPLLVERDHGHIGLRQFDAQTVRVVLALIVTDGPADVLHRRADFVLDDTQAELLGNQLLQYASKARSWRAKESA